MDELATDMEREMQLVNESKTPEARTSPPAVNNMTTSASATSFGSANARVENETIKKWREEQAKRLEEKDDNEAKMMTELKEKAKKELEDWYKKYEEQLGKTKDDNRNTEVSAVAEMNDIQPGDEWNRVHKLCDFNVKNSRNNKDTSRMRGILLQLKQTPKSVKYD